MLNVVVPSGSSTSSAFILERPSHPLCILIPSLSANQLSIAFATSSAGPFLSLWDRRSSSFPTVVFSGTGGASVVIDCVPTPWAKLSFGAAIADTASIALVANRRVP